MKWVVTGLALVIAANAITLATVARERAAPATLATIDICSANVVGGGRSEEPPALLLRTVPDTGPVPAGLDAAGLRALGFSEAVIAAVGQPADSTFRRPRERPAWVRLRQRGDSLERFVVVAVAARRDLLPPDSTSLVVRGRIGVFARYVPPSAGPEAAGSHDHAAMGRPARGTLYPAVVEVIPGALHLDRGQSATLQGLPSDSGGCRPRGRAVIASGASGGIWVEAVPARY